jgi:predicted aconitase with swiveling domain
VALELQGQVQIPGAACAPLLKLARPISFWGGVDPTSALITQPRHPDYGRCVSGHILVLPASIGSSSSASVMLELMARGIAPAALVLAAPDAILTLGVVVAREMGYGSIATLVLPSEAQSKLPEAGSAEVTQSGLLRVLDENLSRAERNFI